jgi:chemotaxis protein MotA
MNLSAPLGFLIGLSVVYFAITQGMKNIAVFMDVHAIIIVIGGTLAAAMVCIPFSQLFNMVRLFFRTVTGAQKEEVLNCINEIVEISRRRNEGVPLKDLIGSTKNPFLKESLDLLSQGGLSQDEFEDVLEKRVEQQNERYKRQGSTFKIIGKFPPAFGLIGATLGMIALLQGLGEPDAFNRLGPAMSVALVATFYGLIVANVFIIPIGENLMHASEDDLVMRNVVMDGVKLIRDSKHPLLVEEYLKSYLTPKDRNGMKKAA